MDEQGSDEQEDESSGVPVRTWVIVSGLCVLVFIAVVLGFLFSPMTKTSSDGSVKSVSLGRRASIRGRRIMAKVLGWDQAGEKTDEGEVSSTDFLPKNPEKSRQGPEGDGEPELAGPAPGAATSGVASGGGPIGAGASDAAGESGSTSLIPPVLTGGPTATGPATDASGRTDFRVSATDASGTHADRLGPAGNQRGFFGGVRQGGPSSGGPGLGSSARSEDAPPRQALPNVEAQSNDRQVTALNLGLAKAELKRTIEASERLRGKAAANASLFTTLPSRVATEPVWRGLGMQEDVSEAEKSRRWAVLKKLNQQGLDLEERTSTNLSPEGMTGRRMADVLKQLDAAGKGMGGNDKLGSQKALFNAQQTVGSADVTNKLAVVVGESVLEETVKLRKEYEKAHHWHHCGGPLGQFLEERISRLGEQEKAAKEFSEAAKKKKNRR